MENYTYLLAKVVLSVNRLELRKRTLDMFCMLDGEKMSIKEENAVLSFGEEASGFNNTEFVAVVKVEKEVLAEDETNETVRHQQTINQTSSCNKQEFEICVADPQPAIDVEKFDIKAEDDTLSVGNETSTLSPFELPGVVKVENEVTSDNEIDETGNSTDSLVIKKDRILQIKTERVDMSPTDVLPPAECGSPRFYSGLFVESSIIIKKEEDLDADEVVQPVDEGNFKLSSKDEDLQRDDKSNQSTYESSAWGLCEEGCTEPSSATVENTPFSELSKSSAFCDDSRFGVAHISAEMENFQSCPVTYAVEERFSCTHCHAQFSASSKLKRHMKIHTQGKPFSCTYCPAKFGRNSTLKYHLRTHTREKPFSCAHCPLKFSQRSTYIRHLRVHTKEKPYSCTLCPAKFSQSGKLKAHLRIHNQEKPFVCTYCLAKFRCNSNLKRHMRIHTDERPFSCTYCPAKFCQSNTLKNHLNTHTNEKPFECTYCSARFCQNGSLKTHLRTHTDEKPFICLICPAKFSLKGSLKTHSKIHNDVKRYACTHCPARFNQKHHLTYHLTTHTQEKWYTCAHCSSKFKLKSQLRNHLRKHSDAEPLSRT